MHIGHAAFYKNYNPIKYILVHCNMGSNKWHKLTWLSLNNVLIMSLMTLIMSLLSESFLSEPKLWSVLQRTHLIYCVQFISMDGHHLVWVHLSWPVLQILKSTKGHQKISFGSFAIILIKMNLQSFLSFNNKVVQSHCVFF